MSIKLGKFKCPSCGRTYKYHPDRTLKYATKEGRLKCKIPYCEYILTKEETDKILRDVNLKSL